MNLVQSTSTFQLGLVPPNMKSRLRPKEMEKPAYYPNKGRQTQVGKPLRSFSTPVFPSPPRGLGDGGALQTCFEPGLTMVPLL